MFSPLFGPLSFVESASPPSVLPALVRRSPETTLLSNAKVCPSYATREDIFIRTLCFYTSRNLSQRIVYVFWSQTKQTLFSLFALLPPPFHHHFRALVIYGCEFSSGGGGGASVAVTFSFPPILLWPEREKRGGFPHIWRKGRGCWCNIVSIWNSLGRKGVCALCVREYQCVGEQKKGQSCKKGGREKGGGWEGLEIGWGRGKGKRAEKTRGQNGQGFGPHTRLSKAIRILLYLQVQSPLYSDPIVKSHTVIRRGGIESKT